MIINLYIFQVLISIGSAGSISHRCQSISVTIRIFSTDIPCSTGFRIPYFNHFSYQIGRCMKHFLHKITIDFRFNPGRPQTHFNLRGIQVPRLHLFQCFYIHFIFRVILCKHPGNFQFFSYIPGQILICIFPSVTHWISKNNAR